MRAPSDRHFIHGSIFLLANRLQTTGDRAMGDITSKQWMLLVAVSSSDVHPPNITSLARDLGVSRQNVAVMLKALEKNGYVQLSGSPGDRRSQQVQLTPKAGPRMAEISKMGAGYLGTLFTGVESEQLACVVSVFRQMFENLDRMEKEGADG